MQITEEQRRRAEANRLAALEKRKRTAEVADVESWKLSKCRNMPSPATVEAAVTPPCPLRPLSPFRAVFEICSPDEFSVTPEPLQGSWFPGEADCLQIIETCVSSVVPFYLTLSQGGRRTSVFKLSDYDSVLRCIKKLAVVELQEIPYTTRLVVEKFSQSVGSWWVPCMEGHCTEEQVDELLGKLPRSLRNALLPFQLEGVRFALRRGGRCLIADEMGLGKTIQAISVASCFSDEGPVLIVCPAVLRFSWAEELEHWLPTLLPKDIHLVFGHRDNLDYLERHPKVVVVSYTMLNRLQKTMLERNWSLMIVDESHNVRCTKKQMESEETKSVLALAAKIKRIILLSGTPSLSRIKMKDETGSLSYKTLRHAASAFYSKHCRDHRPYDIYHQINMLWPGLLGKDKYEFAKSYCSVKLVQRSHGVVFKDFSKGIRLGELNILLGQTVMVRRLKEHVLTQLPPKRRQIVWVVLKAADILLATSSCSTSGTMVMDGESRKESFVDCFSDQDKDGDQKLEKYDACPGTECRKSQKHLSHQEIGIAKLSGFREWFSNHFIFRESEDVDSVEMGLCSQKTIIFAHHLKVLDGIQAFICEKGIKFVRLDGNVLGRERKHAVEAFRFSKEAEDRAHRQGQSNAVNIYIFCAKGTSDESRWLHLNKSFFCCSSMTNGKKYAIKQIEVGSVLHLKYNDNSLSDSSMGISTVDLSRSSGTVLFKIKEVDKSDTGTVKQTMQAIEMYNITAQGNESSVQHNQTTKDHDMDGEEHSLIHENQNIDGHGEHAGQSNTDSICKTIKSYNDTQFDLLENNAFEEKLLSGMSNDVEVVVPEPVIVDEHYNTRAEWLRFEVSQYTGRVHLYNCIPGTDERPRPIFENFRPEELKSILVSGGNTFKEASPETLKTNPAYWNVIKKFFEEWNGLRPIERNKLLGKPLQLPLIAELCYLKDSINHVRGGLLRGGSNRRVTPLSDISCPLPENSFWKKITLHHGAAKEKEYKQAWTTEDVPLCKLCQDPCNGKLAKAPEYFEDLFCNLSCFQEYRIRTSRSALREVSDYSNDNPNSPVLLDKLVHEPTEGNAWHADHIIPVYKGGGECSLENMRTLCVACHSEVTMAQQDERRLERMQAKKQLKIAMKELENIKPFNSTADEGGDKQVAEEDPLFVKVPGSVYSRNEQ
ncbi:hypothetical protein C4D60_Mb07t00970 [Musa balbisiana]|uniref:Helicase ATP-binding domain-containing protein n=1 Tax=Musa balbisiana TaxID=52838 RepID=A0A4S8JCI2_MUSBA|nr:hypothetical protein C4D60_Mb07t00970 [Musa balbisiana]